MADIYITGHRNPDLDSICSALAYANLKNRIDPENNYIPVRCGHIGENAKRILKSLDIKAPMLKLDVTPKVGDIVMSHGKTIDASDTIADLAEYYNESTPPAIPVFDGKDFYGLLSVDDITYWLVRELADNRKIDHLPEIREIMTAPEPPVQADDFLEPTLNTLSKSRKRGLAVFDGDEYIGFVTRRCFLEIPKYKVILVDHNEPKQSIRGIEDAEICEIVDHHRIDAVKTDLPIFIDAEPVGSTCTIVHQLFLRNGLMPDKETAKILLTGIISDTLILRSPTTTPIDISTANTLSIICGEELGAFGVNMFKNVEGLKKQDPEEAIQSDFKTYDEKGTRFGIGQCEVTTLTDLDDYAEKYIKKLDKVRKKMALDWACLMVTDILTEHSVLLCTEHNARKNLQYAPLDEGIYDMPGVMSRKKQLLPEVISAIDNESY